MEQLCLAKGPSLEDEPRTAPLHLVAFQWLVGQVHCRKLNWVQMANAAVLNSLCVLGPEEGHSLGI